MACGCVDPTQTCTPSTTDRSALPLTALFHPATLLWQMTPAVMEQANPGRQDTTAASNQALQLAFQQGVDHAREEMATGQDAATRQQRLEELEHLNQEQARLLHERTEELQKREYRCVHSCLSSTTGTPWRAPHAHSPGARSDESSPTLSCHAVATQGAGDNSCVQGRTASRARLLSRVQGQRARLDCAEMPAGYR